MARFGKFRDPELESLKWLEKPGNFGIFEVFQPRVEPQQEIQPCWTQNFLNSPCTRIKVR